MAQQAQRTGSSSSEGTVAVKGGVLGQKMQPDQQGDP